MILYKKREPIRLFQAGGSIPYYQRFEVQMRPEGTAANIGLMLDKHEKKTQPSAKGEQKKVDSPYKDIKGLEIDKKAYMTKMNKLQEDQDFLMRNDPEGYMNNPKYQENARVIDMMSSSELDHLAKEYENHKKASEKILDASNGYGDQWIMQNGVGVVRNLRTGAIENIPAKFIHSRDKKGPIYQKVMYKEGLVMRDLDDSPVVNLDKSVGSMIVASDFTNKLASGMSTAQAYKDLIEPVYTNIAYDKEHKKVTYKDTEVGEELMDQYTSSRGNKSNARQLKAAFKTLLPRLQSSAGWNTLMADAYLSGALSEDQAEEIVIDQLSNNLASKLGIEKEEETVEDLPEIESTDPLSGLGGDKWKKNPAILDAHRGDTDVVTMLIDKDPSGNPVVKDVSGGVIPEGEIDLTRGISGHKDAALKKLIDKEATLSDQPEDVKDVLRFSKGRFFSGDAMKNVSVELDPSVYNPFRTGNQYSLLDASIIDRDSDIVLTHVAIDPETGELADLKSNPMYQEMLKVIETEGYETAIKTARLPEAKEEAERQLRDIKQIYYQMISDGYSYRSEDGRFIDVKGVNIQKVGITKIITNREDIISNGKHITEDDPLWNQFEEVTDTGKIEDFITAMSKEYTDKGIKKYSGGTDIVNKESGDWVSTYVYIPYTESFSTIVRADKDSPELWTRLEDMTYENVVAKHGKTGLRGFGAKATAEQIENAVK